MAAWLHTGQCLWVITWLYWYVWWLIRDQQATYQLKWAKYSMSRMWNMIRGYTKYLYTTLFTPIGGGHCLQPFILTALFIVHILTLVPSNGQFSGHLLVPFSSVLLWCCRLRHRNVPTTFKFSSFSHSQAQYLAILLCPDHLEAWMECWLPNRFPVQVDKLLI